MIKSFADSEAERIYRREFSKRPPMDIQQMALQKLKGDRQGQCSIRINDQWRVCFTWRGNDAYDVEITDCH